MTSTPEQARRIRFNDFPNYRNLWRKIVISLLLVSLVPLCVIGGGMYHYASIALKSETVRFLKEDVVKQKEAIDLFILDRITMLKAAAETLNAPENQSVENLESSINRLHKSLNCFEDIGVIASDGSHLAYSGPYNLMDVEYRHAEWFQKAIQRNVYVSDVFSGYRAKPHFVIVVKQQLGEDFRLIRATVDAESFNDVALKTARKREGISVLLNKKGELQKMPRFADNMPDHLNEKTVKPFNGVNIVEANGDIRAEVWLDQAPWLNVIIFPKNTIYRKLNQVKLVGLVSFFLGLILIAFTVLLTTNYLVSTMELNKLNIHLLDDHLKQAGKLTTSFKTGMGIINNLINRFVQLSTNVDILIDETCSPDYDREKVRQFCLNVKSEVAGALNSLEDFRVRTEVEPLIPVITTFNVNEILIDVVDIFDQEAKKNNITFNLNLQNDLPEPQSDVLSIQQILVNLLLNAVKAVKTGGVIEIQTMSKNGMVVITVRDDGPGIPETNIQRIFDPLFTTDKGSLGLGLSISRALSRELGGDIKVKSTYGSGTSFIVEIPIEFKAQ